MTDSEKAAQDVKLSPAAAAISAMWRSIQLALVGLESPEPEQRKRAVRAILDELAANEITQVGLKAWLENER